MVITEGSNEFFVIFILTIVLISIKLVLSIYLLIKVNIKRKNQGKLKLDLLLSVFVFIFTLFIARLMLLYFDFVFTKFDNTTFHEMPQIVIWKIAFFIFCIGLGLFNYTIDKKALNFKFKGLLAYSVYLIGFIILIIPVQTQTDFQNIGLITFWTTIISILIPVFFFYMAYLAPPQSDMRKISVSIAIGMIIYAIGGNMISEMILVPVSQVFGEASIISMWIMALILKCSGLTMLAYGSTKIMTS